MDSSGGIAERRAVRATDAGDGGHPTGSALRLPELVGSVFLAFGLAIAQPVLDVIGRNPAFLVAHDAGRVDVVLLGVVISLVAPLVVAGVVGALHGLHRGVGLWAYALLMAAMWALVAVQFLDRLTGSALLLTTAATAVGVCLAAVCVRSVAVRRFFGWGIMVPLAALVMFLVFSPTSRLLRPAAAASSAAAGDLQRHPPIVFIVLDEFPLTSLLTAAGKIDEELYPAFAQLADDASFYTNATTVDPGTEKAVPAMLTGRMPRPRTVPTTSDHPDNLFTMLSETYDMNVTEALTRLCPQEICNSRDRPSLRRRAVEVAPDLGMITMHVLLPRFATEGLPPIDQGWRDFGAGPAEVSKWPGIRAQFHEAMRDDRTEGFLEAAKRLDDRASEPQLHFIHALLPHAPWETLPTGQRYVTPPGIPGLAEDSMWSQDAWAVKRSYQRHLLQVGYVDRLVGEALERLKRVGIYDDSLIIVTGDHGVSFVPGQHYRLFNRHTLGGTAWVPLFVKLPGQRQGHTVEEPVTTIDILPTILGVVGADAAAKEMDGMSLLAQPPAERDRSVPGQRAWPSFDVRYRDATLASKHQTFPNVKGRLTPFSLVPSRAHLRLLGKAVNAEAVGAPAGGVLLEQPWAYAAVDPTGPIIPAEVRGELQLDRPVEGDVALGLAVNGTIEAVTLATREDAAGKYIFSAMLPPAALRRGLNTLDPFVISGSRPYPAPVTNAGSFSVVGHDKNLVLRRPDGPDIPVESDPLGRVDEVREEQDHIVITGWAGDPVTKRPAEVVLLVVDDAVVAATAPLERRGDVVEVTKQRRLGTSGYSLWADAADVRNGSRAAVVAVTGNTASVLPLGAGVPPGTHGLASFWGGSD